MTLSNTNLNNLNTDELVRRFKQATLRGRPPQELIDVLVRRPGIAFIKATDSTEVTLEKARRAIAQLKP